MMHARGKLLLFGEYFVLDGCPALAIPLRYGQRLSTREDEVSVRGLHWKGLDHRDHLWFEAFFDENLNILHSQEEETARTLQSILKVARQLNPDFLKNGNYHEAVTRLDYPQEWGLGSSSTLIYLIARWSGIDPFRLFFLSFPGSGYDIACAGASHPLLYQLNGHEAKWAEITEPLPVLDQVLFVYSGKKQNSREGIARYRERKHLLGQVQQELETIVQEAVRSPFPDDWMQLMQSSEELISSALHLPMVKDQMFPDFPGQVKSLGAWGGDFVMALSSLPLEEQEIYFRKKGLDISFRATQCLPE